MGDWGQTALETGLHMGIFWGGLSGAAAGGLALLFLDRIPEGWLKEDWEEGFVRKRPGRGQAAALVLYAAACGAALGCLEERLPQALLLLAAFVLLGQAAVCDSLYKVLPDQHTAALALLGAARALLAAPMEPGTGAGQPFLAVGAAFGPALQTLGPALRGGLLCCLAAAFLWAPVLLPRGRALLGLGDVKLFGALGLLSGSPQAGLQLLLLAFFLQGLLAGAGLLLGRLTLRTEAPMGPVIALAAAFVLLQ